MKKKRFIILFLFILFIGVFSSASFYFFYEIKESSHLFVKQKKEINNLTSKAKELEKIKNYEEIEETLKEIYSLFADPKNPLDTILFLEEAAEDNNLSIKIDVQRSEKGDPWPYFLFRININGDFKDFILFLEEIESKKWVASIDSLTIEKEEDDEVLLQLSIKNYFLNQ